jgi:hypothetical protein
VGRRLPLLKKYKLSFDLQLLSQAPAASVLIRRNPDVQFVLTHAAMPFARDPEGIALWRRGISDYAAHPNVAIKLRFRRLRPDVGAASITTLSPSDHGLRAQRALASNFQSKGSSSATPTSGRSFSNFCAILRSGA